MNKKLLIDKEKIADFCRQHYIKRLAVFGSVLRDDFGPDSDIDVLVEFVPAHTPGFFQLFDMEEELSGLFGGRKVDMRTPEDLSRYFRDEVVASAKVQYVHGRQRSSSPYSRRFSGSNNYGKGSKPRGFGYRPQVELVAGSTT